MNYDIRRLDESTIEQQVDLFNLVFGQSFDVKMWHHKHFENPDCAQCDIYGAFEEEKLIGINGFISSKYVYGNETYNVLQSCESAVHPDYRGRGVFSRIIKYALAESELKDNNCYIIGFPNTANAYPGFIKMNWSTHTWLMEYMPLSDFARLKLQINFPHFSFLHLQKSFQYHETNQMTAYKSGKYENRIRLKMDINRLNWRTYMNLKDNFVICEIQGNNREALASAIIKKTKVDRINCAEIIDWYVINDGKMNQSATLKKLFQLIRHKYGCLKIKVSQNDPDYCIIKEIGLWEHKKARQPFIGKMISSDGETIAADGLWMPRMIDYDGTMF